MTKVSKIAIYERKNSFSDRWVEYCKLHDISYISVNPFQSSIIEQVKECAGFMWHWPHWDYKTRLFARQLTYSLEAMGVKVFPNSKTCWHYDDKVGQKYLLEALGAPLISTYVFFDKNEALKWAGTTKYPKIFKLRSGAGSSNVQLVKTYENAKVLINKAFAGGYSSIESLYFIKEKLWHLRRDKNILSLFNLGKGLAQTIASKTREKHFPRERDYAYFQDFAPDNDCDIRVIVIGERAFGIKRMVRDGDFRASGSGLILYGQGEIPLPCIKNSFEITHSIGAQCMAYDYIFESGRWKIVEISYAFTQKGYDQCTGYWDINLKWHPGKFNPQAFILEDFLASI